MTGTGNTELRNKIFATENKKPKSKVFSFFGVDIELRQSTLLEMTKLAENTVDPLVDPDAPPQINAVRMVISNSYVPGTDERVFDDADYDQLASMPFGPDVTRMMSAVNELTGLNITAAAKNSETTQ